MPIHSDRSANSDGLRSVRFTVSLLTLTKQSQCIGLLRLPFSAEIIRSGAIVSEGGITGVLSLAHE